MMTLPTFKALVTPAAPILYFLAAVAWYSLALRFYRFRHAIVPVMVLFNWFSLRAVNYWPNEGFGSFWGLVVCIWATHASSTVLLEAPRLTIDGLGPLQSLPWYTQAWETWLNPRLIFTSGAERQTKRPRYGKGTQQSMWSFIVEKSAKLAVYSAIFFYLVPNFIFPTPFAPLAATDFDSTRQTYFRRLLIPGYGEPVTARETYIRAIFTVIWALNGYLFVDGGHCVLALFFVVVLRVHSPSDWRPIYGSLSHASSLRGFWGKFWHRLVVIPYSNFGQFVATSAFGLKPSSPLTKLIISAFIFTLSGMEHSLTAWNINDKLWHLDTWFFVLQFVACAAETAVVGSATMTLLARTGPFKNRLVRKVIGFGWVFLFFFWSAPKWQYPRLDLVVKEMAAPQVDQDLVPDWWLEQLEKLNL